MTGNALGPTRGQMSWLVGSVLVFGVAAVGLPFLFGSPERWEYQLVSPSDFSLTDELDRLGKEGWEVVSARRASDGSSDSPSFSYELILKRRRSALAFFVPDAAPARLAEAVAPQPSSPGTEPDYRMIDRQGTDVFAVINGRHAKDAERLRQFGGNLCGSLKTCTVRFWSEQPSGSLTTPLSAAHANTQRAEYTQTSGPKDGRVSLLR